jgi:hypothetical protein
VAVCSVAVSARATPNAATWRRELLLGSNKDSYFVWVLKWGQGGYSHTYGAGMALERRSLHDRTVLESHDVLRFGASNLENPREWKRTPGDVAAFDIVAYLREQEVSPSFSQDYAFGAELREGALVLVEGDHAALLLGPSELEAQLSLPLAEMREVRVVPTCQVTDTNRHHTEETWFYTLQFNSPSIDDDWSEVLLVVPGARVLEAIERLRTLRP